MVARRTRYGVIPVYHRSFRSQYPELAVVVRWLVGIGIKVLTAIMDFDVADRQEEPAMLLSAGQRQTKGYLRGGSRELESA
jgi:hypothetical protein